MKAYFLLLLFWLPLAAWADDIKEYKASNGVTYHVGDTLTLGRGAGTNGNFISLQVGGFNAFMVRSHSEDRLNVDKSYNHVIATIKHIKKDLVHGADRYYLVVSLPHSPGSYNLYIEDAIERCEVARCNAQIAGTPPVLDKFDQLKKLKELLDSGAITKEEYDAQKKKLLDQ